MSAVPPLVPAPDFAWTQEAEDPLFLRSIERNIGEFETSIRTGKLVDLDFFKILQTDIDLLRAKYRRDGLDPKSHDFQTLNGLNGRLGTLAAQYEHDKHIMIPRYVDPVSVPLAQPQEDVGTAFTDEEVSPADKEALARCSVSRVRGDGHCLFRSITAHLLTAEHLQELNKHRANLERLSPGIGGLIDETLRYLDIATPVEILIDEAFSDRWVAALRKISGAWWNELYRKPDRTHEENTSLEIFFTGAREWLRADESESEQSVLARYKADMEEMRSGSRSSYGGDSEYLAISRAFGLPIHVIDLQTSVRPLPIPVAADLSHIYLLRRPGHFDALFFQPVS